MSKSNEVGRLHKCQNLTVVMYLTRRTLDCLLVAAYCFTTLSDVFFVKIS